MASEMIEAVSVAIRNERVPSGSTWAGTFRKQKQMKIINLHLFLLPDGTRIDENEYFCSLENGTELIVCTEEQIEKISIYFGIKNT